MKKIIFILFLTAHIFAQSNQPTSSTKNLDYSSLIQKLQNHNKFLLDCERQTRDHQLKDFGRVLPKISGDCEWSNNGCPISLVKPHYLNLAKSLNIYGIVKVQIIIDEQGNVVYTRGLKGNNLLRFHSIQAAKVSRFSPKIACGKTIIQKRIISYNFIL